MGNSSKILGSSPRVWGQEAATLTYFLPKRIIPTRVGTSFSVSFPTSNRRDHPHACGDKEKQMEKVLNGWGSSPRVWGQVFVVVSLPL